MFLFRLVSVFRREGASRQNSDPQSVKNYLRTSGHLYVDSSNRWDLLCRWFDRIQHLLSTPKVYMIRLMIHLIILCFLKLKTKERHPLFTVTL